MSKKNRTQEQVKRELQSLVDTHLAIHGPRLLNEDWPLLFNKTEVKSLLQITYLEGYIRGVKDERDEE